MAAIIEVHDLVKTYGQTRAVDGVSFAVEGGEIFGLLGPNGAGKTTAISVICGLIDAMSGTVQIDGISIDDDPVAVKRALGVVPQEIALYPTLSANENLAFWGRMYGLSGATLKQRIAEGLELAGLADRAGERIEKYSGGMKRRINIAAGMLHHPKVLLMDEPTVGVDPQSRNHILETVRGLNERGTTVIYTSHYMEEVEAICDRVGIIDHGKLIALGTIPELKTLVGDESVITVEVIELPEGALARVTAVDGVSAANQTEGRVEVLASDPSATLPEVLAALTHAGARVVSVEVREPNLESVFLHLTGKRLRD